MKKDLLPLLLLTAIPLCAEDARVLHYWDMDTVEENVEISPGVFKDVPQDVVGGLNMTAGENLDLAHVTYLPAGGSGGNYLHTELDTTGVPLLADVWEGGATAMIFTGDFSFSYWSYDDFATDNDVRGPRVFDSLEGTFWGLSLGTNASGIFNFRMDADAPGYGSVVSSDTLTELAQTQNVWTLVVVNVDRGNDTAEVFMYDGAGGLTDGSQGTYGIAVLTSPVVPTQDLEIGVINNGGGAAGLQESGLDDLAFYDGILSARQLADLAAGGLPDVVAPPAGPPAHYWDFDTDNSGDSIPDDLYGGLETSEQGGDTDTSIDSFYGEAFTGANASLNTALGGAPYLQAETHDGANPTALDFGKGSFSFSYWAFDHSDVGTGGDGDPRGVRVFDCLDGTTTGLSVNTQGDGYLVVRLDDDEGNSVSSNNVAGFETLAMPANEWVHVTVNVDRTTDQLTIYFDGVAIPEGAIDISSLTGNIFCTDDLQIGVINGGGNDAKAQKSGLDELAFYPGTLSQAQITALAGAATTPLDVLASFEPSPKIPVVSVSYDAGELTVVFTSENGKTYSVFGGGDLSDTATWPEISAGDILGDGTDLSFPYTPGVTPFFLQVRED